MDANQSALSATLVVLLLVSCSSEDPANPDDTGDGAGNTGVEAVGRGGGTVENEDGASVEVPRGALPREYVISISVVTGPLPDPPDGLELAGEAYAFTPHLLMFSEPITITLPFESSKLGKVVLHLDDERDIDWDVLDNAQYRKNMATLMVDSFSVYAVAHPDSDAMISCDDTRTLCNARCVDINVDNDNCGECRSSCGSGQECMGGVCIMVEVPPMDAGTQQQPDAAPQACTMDSECDDGQFCNGAETCPAGACQAGTAVTCDDGDPTTVDSCDEGQDICVNTSADDAGSLVAI